jgi:hypothetical protein
MYAYDGISEEVYGLATKKGSLIFHSIGLTHLPLSTPATLENMHILIPNPNSIIPSVYL